MQDCVICGSPGTIPWVHDGCTQARCDRCTGGDLVPLSSVAAAIVDVYQCIAWRQLPASVRDWALDSAEAAGKTPLDVDLAVAEYIDAMEKLGEFASPMEDALGLPTWPPEPDR